jgi:DNA-binding transcriptional regulator YiaG
MIPGTSTGRLVWAGGTQDARTTLRAMFLTEGRGAMTIASRWTGREAKLLRQALRLSVRDLAARLGVGVRTVNKWEVR